jgi:hypothetical protein
MAAYRVRPGFVLPHNGEVLEPGTIVELPTTVAEDIEVIYRIQPVDPVSDDAASLPVPDEIEQPTGDARPTEE